MKKIFLGLMGFMGLMGLWCCDKIEEGQYTVYDGAVVSWSASSSTITPTQRVYVEKFTGPRCNNCPRADVTLAGVENENVVIVTINHWTGQGEPYPEEPDMRTDAGTLWDKWFGIGPIPAAYLNRDKSTQYLGEMSNIVGAIGQALTAEPTIGMEVTASALADEIHATVSLQFLKEYTAPVTLTVALVEDSLRYSQLLPDYSVDEHYAHNHMLRKVATSFWGTPVAASGTQGEKLEGSLSFKAHEGAQLSNCHLVAIISDKATRKVLNCASCTIN